MTCRPFATVLLLLTLALPAAADDMFIPSRGTLESADRLVLRKSERSLALYRGGRPIKSYRVSLGLSPEGHKEREGDFRTPEGRYMLTWRNPQSEYFLSIKVSYPNAEDVANARRNGWPPGGAIMIHGLPNVPRHPRERYLSTDWTDGCIAVSNEDMLEIWLLTEPNTPIEILP